MTTEEQYQQYVITSFVKGIEPVIFDSASGVTVRDRSGREYLDCFSGISVVNVGHRHPRVVEAARRQIEEHFIHCCSYMYYAPPVGDLAERLARISPGRLQKTFFSNSGAEAIEGALRLARLYSGKLEVIALQQSFHGRTAGTLAVTGNMNRKTRGLPGMGVAFAPAPYSYRCRYCRGSCTLQCADAVEDVVRYQSGGNVAAFLTEAVMGEGGIIVPPRDYFQRVEQILKTYDILFIDDEVQSGFGRCGYMFAIEHYGVEPDILAMAKGIADGFPLGGFIAPAEMADAFQPGEHLSTFGGNPVSCAAASATVDVLIDEGLPRRAAELGQWTMERLRVLEEKHQLIGEVRGLGLMIGVELVRDRETKEPATREAADIRRFCRERGILIGVGGQDGNVVRIQPPLIISRDHLDHMLHVLDEALATVVVPA